jgi:hypothetical protein
VGSFTLTVVSGYESRRGAQRERVARSEGVPARAASRACAVLTGRVRAAHLFPRAREKPAAEDDFSTAGELAGPAASKARPRIGFL